MLTTEERRLLHIFRSGSAVETAVVVRDALADISEPDVRDAAESLLRKLECMSEAEFAEMRTPYAG